MFDRCLYFNSNVLVRKIEKIWIDAYSEVGLAPAHAYFLRLVLEKPGLAQREIVVELSLDKSTITRFVDKMALDGYLYRAASPTGNLKEQCIFPTEKCLRLKEPLNAIGAGLYKRMQEVFSPEELKSMVGWMRSASQKL
ncbi:MAG: MarR family transcriptional regulator [Xanthomonadales bacterium]|nr:MarR family transcriptional regulator [Xanthomonadales bacterium]